MRDDELLDSLLDEFTRFDGDVETFLSHHPSLPSSVASSLRASAWLAAAPGPTPSPEFRLRARQNFVATLVERRERRSRWSQVLERFAPSLRAASIPLGVALALSIGTAGVYTVSAQALPDQPLYSAKLAFDQIRVFAALTPREKAQVHLAVANERLREAHEEERAGQATAAAGLLQRYQNEVNQARQSDPVVVRSPTATERHPDATSTSKPEVARSAPARGAEPASRRETPEGKATRGDEGHPTAQQAEATSTTLAAPTSTTRPLPPTHPPDTIPPVARVPDVTVPPVHPVPLHPVPNVPAPPTPVPVPGPTSDVLLGVLLRQVPTGDPGAAATLGQYVASVQATKAAGDGWSQRLRVHRAILEGALAQTSGPGRVILENALQTVNAALGSEEDQSTNGAARAPSSTGGQGIDNANSAPATNDHVTNGRSSTDQSSSDHSSNDHSSNDQSSGHRLQDQSVTRHR